MTLHTLSFLLLFCALTPWPCNAQVPQDVQLETHVYAHRETGPLALDLRLPLTDSPCPMGVVFVHGGGFQMGTRDSETVTAFLDTLARAGVVSASISYRLSMQGRGFGCDVPTADKRHAVALAGEDLEEALTWLESQHQREGWPAQWVAAGSSAGAETAMWSGYVHAPERWAGVLSISGAVDATAYPTAAAPPLLALHGQCDALVPMGADIHHFCPKDSPGAWALIGGPAWADSLSAVGVSASTWVQCGGGHGVCNTAMSNPAVLDLILEWLQSGGQTERRWWEADGRLPLQVGGSSCPQPCD